MWIGVPSLLSQKLQLDDTGCALVHSLRPGRYAVRAFPDDLAFEPE